MKHFLMVLTVFAWSAGTARAHFVWIVPDKDGKSAQIVFSDTPSPDDPKLLSKINKIEVFQLFTDNNVVSLKWTKNEDAFKVPLPPGGGPSLICGVCVYGVVQKKVDDTNLQDQKDIQEIVVLQAAAAKIKAEQRYDADTRAEYALKKVLTERQILLVTLGVEDADRRTALGNLITRSKAQEEANIADKKSAAAVLKKETERMVDIIERIDQTRKQADPFLLNYYARALVSAGPNHALAKAASAKLPLDIVAANGKFQVLFEGKPLAGAEVVFSEPTRDTQEKTKADNKGFFQLGSFKGSVCGIRASHIEKKEGEHAGKKYKEIRHYTTLVLELAGDKKPAKEADPQATKLLADARAARAQWEKFPGFSADIEVNIQGKLSKGKVTVASNGKVSCQNLDADAEAWAKRQLGSVVAHRIDDSTALNTPCAFADNDVNNPLGRAITVLNDELHSSYRVRDRQIIVVNRDMKTVKFSITVLENRTNKEGKFLPAAYVVHYWDGKSGDLQKTESHSQTWTRVDGLDLPVTAYVITATRNISARSLTLSNHQVAR